MEGRGMTGMKKRGEEGKQQQRRGGKEDIIRNMGRKLKKIEGKGGKPIHSPCHLRGIIHHSISRLPYTLPTLDA